MSGFRFKNNGGPKKGRANQHNSLTRPTDGSFQPAVKPTELKRRQLQSEDVLDASFGYSRYSGQAPRTAFIFNIRETMMLVGDPSTSQCREYQAIDIYCLQEDGGTFKTTYIFHPYLLLKVHDDQLVPELEEWLGRYFEGMILEVKEIWKEDLDLPNHLSGKKQRYIQIFFRTSNDLYACRKEVQRLIDANTTHKSNTQQYYSLQGMNMVDSSKNLNSTGLFGHQSGAQISSSNTGSGTTDLDLAKEQEILRKIHGDKRQSHEKVADCLIELREFDVPFVQRISIDTKLRCGLWYDFFTVSGGTNSCSFTARPDLESRPQMRIMAYDIETCKAPLKFPNSQVDHIMMISLMLDGQGVLITNRQIVSEDIEDFDYTPKPEYDGPFTIINTPTEKACLEAFLDYIKKVRPQVIVTYNGDFFDFPYIDIRCEKYGISLENEIGIAEQRDLMSAEYKGRFIVHLDAFCWVQRDSYLPQGSQGLKAVTKAKLKYDPIELHPEDMMPFARTKPKLLAQYSVSDAVATYYLYMKYVHLFIFSLCTIIPLTPNEVLRKGSGTLCETLLMVQAFEHNVVAPNKQHDDPLKFYQGHLLESETYVGGHVECLHSGVYRSDIPIKFELRTAKLKELMDSLDSVLTFAITKEWKKEVKDVTNYQEIRDKIFSQLSHLHDNPVSYITPFIYHLDVGAMYPNIILTNRLQPYAMVDETICATCDYNVPDAICKRTLEWTWRGKYFHPTKSDYSGIRTSLEFEPLSKADKDKFGIPLNSTTAFHELRQDQQADIIKNRVKAYSRNIYRKLTEEKLESRHATTCQREHPFYIDTVRAFRDRRYLYKELNKTWGDNLNKAKKAKDALREQQCKDMILLYDSMQLAHKCILNSFYGYVMRKGSRWSSMPMAGVVTRTGAKLIQRAEDLVCSVGKVLELDTDGIWCVLPSTFPENYSLKHSSGGSFKMSFPCSVLNHQVDDKHTNHQYHQVPDEYWKSEDNKLGRPPTYDILSECSIFFEVDGPYKAMVLPASQHEGKNIKKRYAVFHLDGSLAELKGFEIKRRGELKLIKVFQEDVFKVFLKGTNLIECYSHVGAAANKWLDVLQSRGEDLEDSVVFDLISENKSMSERLEDYGTARSTSITCARRLGEFLGPEMVKDKGLNCHFVIVKFPPNAPVSERAVPVKIWDSPETVKKYYLRRWLSDGGLNDFDIRSLLDWEYYTNRLNSAIQKIITIPAAFQEVVNPVPRVIHPDWLIRQLKKRNEPADKNILEMFHKLSKQSSPYNTTTTATTTTTTKPGFFTISNALVDKSMGTQTIGSSLKSVFDQFDAEELAANADMEDFASTRTGNRKNKMHPMYQKTATASIVVLDDYGNEIITNDDGSTTTPKNRSTGMGIDDDDDGNGIYVLSKPRSRPKKDDNDFDLGGEPPEPSSQQPPPAPIGSTAWLVQRQAEWLREARMRRQNRSRNQPDQISTAQLVDSIGKRIQKDIREQLGLADKDTVAFDTSDHLSEVSSDEEDVKNDQHAKKQSAAQEMIAEMQRKQAQQQSQQQGHHKTWHIVGIQPHPAKFGVFNAWVNVELNLPVYDAQINKTVIKTSHQMKNVVFTVDRHIFVHSSIPDPNLADFGTLVTNIILPHGVKTKFLYEVVMDEATWQHDHHSILDQFTTIPTILGVYQHDLSLLFKTILDLGNMVHGLDDAAVVFDSRLKKPIPKVWNCRSELVSHSNITHTSPQTNPTRYLISPQEIYRHGYDHHTTTIASSMANSIKLHHNSSTVHQNPSIAPLFIFHRESHDLYLSTTHSQAAIDRQRTFFTIFDPTKLSIVFIASGPGAMAYQHEIASMNQVQQTAMHSRLLFQNAHETFIQWFISSHLPHYFQSLSQNELLLLETSDVNIASQVLLSKLTIQTQFSNTAKDAYLNLNTWLFNRNKNVEIPILPVISTSQDLPLIISLLYHQQQQQQQSDPSQHSQSHDTSLNRDYSLAFIPQSYPFLYTHVQRTGQDPHNNADESSSQSTQSKSPVDNSDNPFATLQWVSQSIDNMYTHISDIYVDYTRRLHLSRLVKVPVCNINTDISLYVLDIFFARALQEHRLLVWNNRSSIIDVQSQYLSTTNNNLNMVIPYSTFFGQVNNNTNGANSSGANSSGGGGGSGHSNGSTELDLLNPSLMNPGCHRSLCFDIELQDFALNALLNYSHLPDQAESDTLVSIHGTGTAGDTGDNTSPNLEQQKGVVVTTDSSSVVFRIFRTLLQSLTEQRAHLRSRQARQEQEQIDFYRGLEHQVIQPHHQKDFNQLSRAELHYKYQQILSNLLDVTAHLNHIEGLINNVYRYITSSQHSILYDKMLHVYIHRIMKKALIIMIKEISKLYTIIIFSSFERLIISTDKTHEAVAMNRLQSVTAFIQQQPLFSRLRFCPTNIYYSLLFMDLFNYAGVVRNQSLSYETEVTYDSAYSTTESKLDPNHDPMLIPVGPDDDLDDPAFLSSKLKQKEAEWDEYQMTQKFSQQLQIAAAGGGCRGPSKGMKHSKLSLDQSDLDPNDHYDDGGDDGDDGDDDDDDGGDSINADISHVDVDGSFLRKKQHKSRFESLMADMQVDFGQMDDRTTLVGSRTSMSEDLGDISTIPLDDNGHYDSLPYFNDDDEKEKDDKNLSVSLRDPMSPLKEKARQRNNTSSPQSTVSDEALRLKQERRKNKYSKLRTEMEDDAEDDEHDAITTSRANRFDRRLAEIGMDGYDAKFNDDDDAIELDVDDLKRQQRKKQLDGRANLYANMQEFFDDGTVSSQYPHSNNDHQHRRSRARAQQDAIAMAVAVTESALAYDDELDGPNYATSNNDFDEDGVPINTTTLGTQYFADEDFDTNSMWTVEQQWNIATFLPIYAENIFKQMIKEFLTVPFEAFTTVEKSEFEQDSTNDEHGNAEEDAGIASNISHGNVNKTNQLVKTMEPKKRHSWYKENLSRYIEFDILPVVLEQITSLRSYQDDHIRTLRERALQQRASALSFAGETNTHAANGLSHVTDINDDSAFPSRPGKHIHMTNVALEFVKLFCHVLSLDHYIVNASLELKATCLKKLQVQAFTPLSHYQQPCRTFVLPNVCCSRCGHTKDTDLCRDSSLFLTSNNHPHTGHRHHGYGSGILDDNQELFGVHDPHHNGSNNTKWACSHCHSPYNKAEIESRLIQIVQQSIQLYQQQDVICPKCRQMKSETLTVDCPTCSVNYVLSQTYRQQQQQFTSLYFIARQHRFPFLEEMLQWVLSRK